MLVRSLYVSLVTLLMCFSGDTLFRNVVNIEILFLLCLFSFNHPFENIAGFSGSFAQFKNSVFLNVKFHIPLLAPTMKLINAALKSPLPPSLFSLPLLLTHYTILFIQTNKQKQIQIAGANTDPLVYQMLIQSTLTFCPSLLYSSDSVGL